MYQSEFIGCKKIIDDTRARISSFFEEYKNKVDNSPVAPYTQKNINLEESQIHLANINKALDFLDKYVTEINEKTNKKILEIDFSQTSRKLSNCVKRKSKNGYVAFYHAGTDRTKDRIYSDEITDKLLNILENSDSRLNYLLYRLFLTSKEKNIDIIELKGCEYTEDFTDDLREVILNNENIKYIKIPSVRPGFLEDEFFDLIKTAPQLCGIEFQSSSNVSVDIINKLVEKLPELGDRLVYLYFKGIDTFIIKNKNEKSIVLSVDKQFAIPSSMADIYSSKNGDILLPYLVQKYEQNKNIINDLDDHWYAIEYAVALNDFISVKYLIDHKCDFKLNFVGNADDTILHNAIRCDEQNNGEILKYILKHDDIKKDINKCGVPLVFFSAKLNKAKHIQILFEHGAELIKKNDKLPIEIALENKAWESALELLKLGSSFPVIKFSTAENLVQYYDKVGENGVGSESCDFYRVSLDLDVKEREALLEYIKKIYAFESFILNGNINAINQALTEGLLKPTFIGHENKSATLLAIESKKFDIYALLKSNGFSLLDNERADFLLNDDEKIIIINEIAKYTLPDENSSQFYLLSRSRVIPYNAKNFDAIKKIYSQLSEIKEVRQILEVLAYSHTISKIVFDFGSNNVQDIHKGDTAAGVCNYIKAEIYIGAKVDEQEELLGTVAHELTHQAMQIIFNNHCNPYYEENCQALKLNKIIENIKDKIKEKKINIDVIISRVFNYYYTYYPSEIIVRVPHMLAKYGSEKGNRLLFEQTPELLAFYNNYVVIECDKFIQSKKAKDSLSPIPIKPNSIASATNYQVNIPSEETKENSSGGLLNSLNEDTNANTSQTISPTVTQNDTNHYGGCFRCTKYFTPYFTCANFSNDSQNPEINSGRNAHQSTSQPTINGEYLPYYSSTFANSVQNIIEVAAPVTNIFLNAYNNSSKVKQGFYKLAGSASKRRIINILQVAKRAGRCSPDGTSRL